MVAPIPNPLPEPEPGLPPVQAPSEPLPGPGVPPAPEPGSPEEPPLPEPGKPIPLGGEGLQDPRFLSPGPST
jgi:hypothetical protein